MDNESVNNFWSILRADEISDFMDLLNLAEKILKRKVADIKILAGGLTNKSFKVVFEDGLTVAMRIAGRGTGEYISRKAEKNNSTMAAGMGIAPEVYYFDPETGSQLVEFVKLPTMHIEDFQKNPDVLKNAAQIMKTLHSSGIKFLGAFDPVAGIEDYVKTWNKRNLKTAMRAGTASTKPCSAFAMPMRRILRLLLLATTTRLPKTSCMTAKP
jgi:thiamine kinase-like enzyme